MDSNARAQLMDDAQTINFMRARAKQIVALVDNTEPDKDIRNEAMESIRICDGWLTRTAERGKENDAQH